MRIMWVGRGWRMTCYAKFKYYILLYIPPRLYVITPHDLSEPKYGGDSEPIGMSQILSA
jgi:hypothetical protein